MNSVVNSNKRRNQGLALSSVAGANALGFLAVELDLHESIFAVFLLAVFLTSW